jgi:hypothetical protein
MHATRYTFRRARTLAAVAELERRDAAEARLLAWQRRRARRLVAALLVLNSIVAAACIVWVLP